MPTSNTPNTYTPVQVKYLVLQQLRARRAANEAMRDRIYLNSQTVIV